MSKQEQHKVLELFISTNDEQKRLKKNAITVDESGVLEDKFYAKNNDRLILVTSLHAYSLAKKNNIELTHGELGENILIDADISHLHAGDKFKIDEVVLEITQNCSLCKGLTALDSKLPKILKDDRGVFVKAINGGTINIGDLIHF